MAWTPYNAGELPTLVDVTKRMDPDGTPAKIAEVLTQFNPILQDIPMVEGNLPTGHRTTVRAGLPAATWRMLNYGVRPTKSSVVQVDDTIGMLEDYGEVDKDLAGLNGNTAEFRMSEDTPHLESMSNNMASTIFYGDVNQYPQRFHGLAPRYNILGVPANKFTAQANSAYLRNIIGCGGSAASQQTSVWLITWGENTVHGIYPKGSAAGISAKDLGEVTLQDNDGGRFQGYRSHYQWKMGLTVRDWRYIVRIANIELKLMGDANHQKALYQAMIKALYVPPQSTVGRRVFYCSPAVAAMLALAAVEKTNAALTFKEIFGQEVLMFWGVPIRPCNAILETEAVLT